MSDELDQRRSLERLIGRPLTEEEWEFLRECERRLADLQSERDEPRWASAAPYLELVKRLKTRQGSHVPDFDELYRRKAEL